MQKQLPVRPNLEHLKSQAKDLIEAFRRKEPQAFQRFRAALPAANNADDRALEAMQLALHDAQSVIAREYGFASWADLRAHVKDASETPQLLTQLIQRQRNSPLPNEVQQALIDALSHPQTDGVFVATSLPVVAVRNAVLTVGSIVPLSIGRRTSLAAVEAVRHGQQLLAIFSQQDEANEAPHQADLHPIGCAVRLLSVITTPDHAVWIVVRAIQWIRLEAIEQTDPYLMACFTPFEVHDDGTTEVQAIEQTLRERVRALAVNLPASGRILGMLDQMNALQLADATVANLVCSVDDKVRYTNESNLLARLKIALALVDQPGSNPTT